MRALAIITLVVGTTFVGSVATAVDAEATVLSNVGAGGVLAAQQVVAGADNSGQGGVLSL